jgi:hypothetical protein
MNSSWYPNGSFDELCFLRRSRFSLKEADAEGLFVIRFVVVRVV